MQNAREGFLGIFLEEWKMFMDGAAKDVVAAEERRDGNFDIPVKAGELRIFADCDRPLTGLLYKQVDDSWIVVPVSEFSVPATEQEILIGKRVYQLWNSFTASSTFVGRSWVVDDIPTSDMKDLNAALLHVMVGDPISEDLTNCTGLPITLLEDPRLEYERKFVANVSEKVGMRLIGPGLEESEKNQLIEIWFGGEVAACGIAAADDQKNALRDCVIPDLNVNVRVEAANNEKKIYVRVYGEDGEPSNLIDGWEILDAKSDVCGRIKNGFCVLEMTAGVPNRLFVKKPDVTNHDL